MLIHLKIGCVVRSFKDFLKETTTTHRFTDKKAANKFADDQRKLGHTVYVGSRRTFMPKEWQKDPIEWMVDVTINEDTFADLHPSKGQWEPIPAQTLVKNQHTSPSIDTELFDLIDTTYSYIGGHVDFRRPSDLPANHTIWYGTDVDGDKEPDATVFGKRNHAGVKWTGLASDGTPAAKAALIDYMVKRLFQRGNFMEASDAIAHVLITRYSVPFVATQQRVEYVIGKKVDWVGENPKYPKYDGWYTRVLGGTKHLKILLGRV